MSPPRESSAGRPVVGGAPPRRRSAAWTVWFRWQYRLIRLFDPLVRAWLERADLADTVDLVIVGRRSGRPRPVLVGLLVVGGRWYVGHPNGPARWTLNLDAAGRAVVRLPRRGSVEVAARPLGPGPERSAVVRATFVQHPFPGNLVYRLAGRHVEAVGAFYRLEPVLPAVSPSPPEVAPAASDPLRAQAAATARPGDGRPATLREP
jgi:hypothetical protein